MAVFKTNSFTNSGHSKVHIVHILHSFGTGGMEKGVATLVRHASVDIQHSILCLTRSGRSSRLLPEGTKVFELHKKPGNSPYFLIRLAMLLKKMSADVVHTRNWAGTDGILAAWLAGIPAVVHSEHGFGSENPTGNNRKRVWAYRILSLLVKEYICVSKPLEKWIMNTIGTRTPVAQIYNGVDTQCFKPGDSAFIRTELGIPSNAFVVGIVASLYPIKNHITLIEAFKQIRFQERNSYLIIVGDGEEREKLERMVPEGVFFLGNRSDVPRIMRELDVFVLCSLNEGISNTILEAMATGLPVIASDVGGNPDLVINNVTGKLFPVGDVDALSNGLFDYLNSPERKYLHGKRGRDRVSNHFSIQSMIEQYETVWKRVAS